MANGDEPERILQQAISCYKVVQILKEKPDDRNEAVALVVCLLEAFTSELLLKCLIRIEGVEHRIRMRSQRSERLQFPILGVAPKRAGREIRLIVHGHGSSHLLSISEFGRMPAILHGPYVCRVRPGGEEHQRHEGRLKGWFEVVLRACIPKGRRWGLPPSWPAAAAVLHSDANN